MATFENGTPLENGTGRLRADTALVEQGLAESRTAAQRCIREGRAYANGQRIEKPSQMVDTQDKLSVKDGDGYVSRGAYKLMAALTAFGVDPTGQKCADIGASTGGFTQVLLQKGAERVWAVDVGTNQLAPSLRVDPRVTVLENTNARYLTEQSLSARVELLVYDVSFISAALLFPALSALLADDGDIIGLIKPQFEAGRQAVGKNGVVKAPADHERAIHRLRDSAAECGLVLCALIPSPIRGGEGNIEYLARFRTSGVMIDDKTVRETVRAAFETLK